MNAVERYNEFEEQSLDQILVWIRNGTIKCGKYAHRVKVDKDFKIKGKELFKDGK